MTLRAAALLALANVCLAGAPGGLRVDRSGRYFTENGRPWLWLGDTAWPLMVSYTAEEADAYLAARAQLGFSIVQMAGVWDGGTGTEHGKVPDRNFAGAAPWRGQDPLQPEEAYWKNVDRVVAAAARHGLYVGLLPSWGSFVVERKLLNPQNAEQYGRWIGARYKTTPNIVWIVGGDRKTSAAPEIWRQIAHGLQEGDGGAHPITFHPGGERKASSDAFASEPWLAANMIQTWADYTDIPDIVRHDYELKPPKPVILGEGAYEEGPEYPSKPITPLVVRKQAYWAYLSGGSFTYGHNDMWRKNPTWRKSLRSEGARNLAVLKKVLESVDWWRLTPDNSLLAGNDGSGAGLNVAARSADGKWALLYFSQLGAGASDARIRVDLRALKGERFRSEWIDTQTGVHAAPQECSRTEVSRPPRSAADDALLLVKAR